MSFGIELWDTSGNVLLNVSDSLTKFITTFTISGSGSTTVPGIAGQRVWYTCYCISSNISNYVAPVISISGTTVTYTYWSSHQNCTSQVFIGVY